jgi:Flp pilus assembly protein TadG
MKKLLKDQDGNVLVEATIMMTILFTFLLGAVDYLFAFYQWNAASKAAALGARIAAVSDPVATGLSVLSQNAVSSSVLPGGTMPAFTVTCPGNATSCTCTGFCTGLTNPAVNQTALNRIVYGRGNNGSCNTPASVYFAGMCNMFPGLTPDKVQIVYTSLASNAGGLGYAGRPDGPVPTVQVSLRNLNFSYYFLGGLLHLGSISIPPYAAAPTTVTGEALSSSAQCLTGSC